MIYNHYTQPKIFSESSKNCQKQVLFTPTETSPISYSTQTLNSKEKYLRKINTDDLEKKKILNLIFQKKTLHQVQKILKIQELHHQKSIEED